MVFFQVLLFFVCVELISATASTNETAKLNQKIKLRSGENACICHVSVKRVENDVVTLPTAHEMDDFPEVKAIRERCLLLGHISTSNFGYPSFLTEQEIASGYFRRAWMFLLRFRSLRNPAKVGLWGSTTLTKPIESRALEQVGKC
ncbi:hypothetical protein ACTXT7_015593, partial [Hymenolepis weldensis]